MPVARMRLSFSRRSRDGGDAHSAAMFEAQLPKASMLALVLGAER